MCRTSSATPSTYASCLKESEVPILGVNMGTLGFLTEVPRDRAIPMLERALRGELPMSRRLMLDVEVRLRAQVRLTGSVLNDAVVSKNALSRSLATLEHPDAGVFLRGMRHIQMEPIWGGRSDTAGTLRATCALALAPT